MKPIDMKICTYIEFHVENNDADPKFKVGDYMRISKYKNKFEYPKFQQKMIVRVVENENSRRLQNATLENQSYCYGKNNQVFQINVIRVMTEKQEWRSKLHYIKDIQLELCYEKMTLI